MKMKIFFTVMGVFALFASCSGDQRFNVKKQPIEPPAKEANGKAQYKVGVGDVLEVLTWKEPDFSRDIRVRMDGKISFPLLDDIQAAGRSTADIKDEIENNLKDYINHPVVSVSIKLPESQKIYILGEVLKPGEYPLAKQLTVLQALAMCGGFTEWASKDEILVIRDEAGETTAIPVDYNDLEAGEALEQNIALKADDIIVIP